ncbi:hypothetical protein [uncultured Ruminococcus sp.]|uniref:hypothetical protein n=1 Tax=uncultured Ruminococcus sp. TaxID=165186 RepID=UPI0025D7418A|nr:hypothetical protein [uncultured Ruminococcus sp.]
MSKCVLCGKEVEERKPCPYNRKSNGPTCDECCEACYKSEPFPCREHEQRKQINRRN